MIIPDPDFDGFDGCYIGIENSPEIDYDLRKIMDYARASNKKLSEVTLEEIESFRIR